MGDHDHPTAGTRVELLSMPADPCPITPGTRGTVRRSGGGAGFGYVAVAWDDGRALSLIPGVDRWREVKD
jgi:hypothetical protein